LAKYGTKSSLQIGFQVYSLGQKAFCTQYFDFCNIILFFSLVYWNYRRANSST